MQTFWEYMNDQGGNNNNVNGQSPEGDNQNQQGNSNNQSVVANRVKQERINREVQKILANTPNPRDKELFSRVFQNPTASAYFWDLMRQGNYQIGTITPNLRKTTIDKRRELELTPNQPNTQTATNQPPATQPPAQSAAQPSAFSNQTSM